ncbi:MAG: NUDIX domain-containing protein [Panacibacter sp.]
MPVKIIAAGGLVTNEHNELLMIFRRGKWDLPKGKLDDGETITQCAAREVEEETGMRNLELGNFIGLTFHEYFDKWINDDAIKETHWYAMKVKGSPTPTPQAEEHIEKIIWAGDAAIKECLKNSYQNIEDIIAQFKGKQKHL